MSACISVLASPGIALGWLNSSGPGAHWPPFPYPASRCPGRSIQGEWVTSHHQALSPSHPRRHTLVMLSGHQRASLRLKIEQALELARRLRKQGVMRSEVQGVFFRRDATGFGWALLLLLWTQCPVRRHGWRGPTWVFPVVLLEKEGPAPRSKDAFGVSVLSNDVELPAESILTLSIYTAFLPSCELTFLKWPMWKALSHTICMFVIEIEDWELAVTCMYLTAFLASVCSLIFTEMGFQMEDFHLFYILQASSLCIFMSSDNQWGRADLGEFPHSLHSPSFPMIWTP